MEWRKFVEWWEPLMRRSLVYPWKNADALSIIEQDRTDDCSGRGSEKGSPGRWHLKESGGRLTRRQVFRRRDLGLAVKAGAAVPFLSEPWYCCAETYARAVRFHWEREQETNTTCDGGRRRIV